MDAVDPYEHLRIYEWQHWILYLHEDQTFLGRCYVTLRRAGEIDPFVSCWPEEWDELIKVVMPAVIDSLHDLAKPDLLNYANLRNQWKHCHWHIVPRYEHTRQVNGWDFHDPVWGSNWSEAKFSKAYRRPVPPGIRRVILEKIREKLK